MTVAVVGLGLIGGSFYKAAQAAGHVTLGLHHGDSAGLGEAELVLVCLPPDAIVPWVREHAAGFRKGAVVVDICGVKRPIVEAMAAVPQEGWRFVGGHPMAGREVSGYENSLAELFVGASMVLTPSGDVPAPLLASLKAFFASVGFARTVVTTAERHDEMIAFTSQLGHVIATTYARDARLGESVGFSAGSFANMTRIATQDAAVWRALYSENRDVLVKVLDGFLARFHELRDAIAADDGDAVTRLIDEGAAGVRRLKEARDV